jgi:hypothetical protein
MILHEALHLGRSGDMLIQRMPGYGIAQGFNPVLNGLDAIFRNCSAHNM